MQRNLELQLQYATPMSHTPESKSKEGESTREWISALNTSVLTTRAAHVKDRSHELSDIMKSPEFAALVLAAQHLAQSQNISKEEATERLVETFRKMDRAWKQLVMKKGIEALLD